MCLEGLNPNFLHVKQTFSPFDFTFRSCGLLVINAVTASCVGGITSSCPTTVPHKPKSVLGHMSSRDLGLQSPAFHDLAKHRPAIHFKMRWICSLNDQSAGKMSLFEILRILRAAPIAGCGGHPATNYVRIAAATQLQWRRVSSTQGAGRYAHAPAAEAREDESDAETVQVEYRGNIFRAKKGSILRSALLRNGASPHNDKAMYVNCR